jgi:hypothetical protein
MYFLEFCKNISANMLEIGEPIRALVINSFLLVFKTNANIWFNKQAITQKVTPNYVKIKVAGTSLQAKRTQRVAELIRIKNELKFLYKKKQTINNQLYSIHLEAATFWDRNWNIIEENIREKLNLEMEKKYAVLNKKLNKLNRTSKYPYESEQKQKFSQRVQNLTTVGFNTDEIRLLSKGLQYNLPYTNKSQWLDNLVMETEAAITRLPILDQEGFRYLARHNIDKIINNKNNTNIDNKNDHKCLKSIKQKLLDKNYLSPAETKEKQ